MSNNEMIYKPYAICKVVAFFFQMLGLFFIAMLGIAIKQYSIDGMVVTGSFLCACCVLTKYMCNLMKITIIFNEVGVRVFNAGNIKQYIIPWKDIMCGYYCRDWHGNLYLVLTSKEIEQKEVKKKVNKHTNSLKSNIYVDKCLFIVISSTKQMEQIEAALQNKQISLFKY